MDIGIQRPENELLSLQKLLFKPSKGWHPLRRQQSILDEEEERSQATPSWHCWYEKQITCFLSSQRCEDHGATRQFSNPN